ncbi:hypothetical protein [Nocardiopsis nanhaiensis]
MSRSTRARLERAERSLPPPRRDECVSHGQLCPASSPYGGWPGGEGVAVAYQQRHGVDFRQLRCRPGDGTDARHWLAQAGVLHTLAPNGDSVIYMIIGIDLETMA